jgi:repressor LexA
MLTKKQHELLTFISARLRETGFSPSFEEMKEALNLKSKSGIHRLITALEERGFIRRLPHRARALEVIRLPDSVMATRGGHGDSRVIEAKFGRDNGSGSRRHLAKVETTSHGALSGAANDGGAMVELPLYGRIAAGTPIEALADPSATIQLPAALIGTGEHYALEVAGDSMVDAGIFDGDTAIIQRTSTALNGEIVVALVDREEATLKRLRRKGNSVALEPANKRYETRIFGPNRVEVQGRLVGLFRKY